MNFKELKVNIMHRLKRIFSIVLAISMQFCFALNIQISKTVRLTESKSFDIRVEAFNVFNHAQFYGPSSVDGEVNDSNFGQVVSAAAPRLVQVAAKVHF